MSVGAGVRATMRGVFALLVLALAASGSQAQQAARVRAVLFYSPTCPHCHEVMTVSLPPLLREYGERLQIVAISTATRAGAELYQQVVEELAIPEERLGVPALIVGRTVLVGSSEIPDRFPGMVRQALAGGGQDWPEVVAIRERLREQGLLDAKPAEPAPTPAAARADSAPTAASSQARAEREAAAAATARLAPAAAAATAPATTAPTPASGTPGSGSPAAADSVTARPTVPVQPAPAVDPGSPSDGVVLLDEASDSETGMLAKFRADRAGNTLAVAILFLMLLVLGALLASLAGRISWRPGPEWLTPALALAGMAVALYLSFVEVTGAEAVCGPVGDCNTVQQSPYARVAGVPVGLLGVLGYLALLGAWAVAVAGPARHRATARVLIWGAALLGTLFSVYLTFLEPFVIGASCAWCLTSALIMTLLLVLATPRALAVRAGGRG